MGSVKKIDDTYFVYVFLLVRYVFYLEKYPFLYAKVFLYLKNSEKRCYFEKNRDKYIKNVSYHE